MESALGTFIAARLKANGTSVRSFAKKLGPGSSYISKVIKGARPVPYAKISAWSAALGLEGKAAAAFKELALLELAPVEVRELVAELREELVMRRSR